jgi:hypothetical protein
MIIHNIDNIKHITKSFAYEVKDVINKSNFQLDGNYAYVMITLNVNDTREGELEGTVQANRIAEENGISKDNLSPQIQSESYINNQYNGIFVYQKNNIENNTTEVNNISRNNDINSLDNNIKNSNQTTADTVNNGGLMISNGMTESSSITESQSEDNSNYPIVSNNVIGDQTTDSTIQKIDIKKPKWILVIPVDVNKNKTSWDNINKWDKLWLVPQTIDDVNLVTLYGDTLDKRYLSNSALSTGNQSNLLSSFNYLSNKYHAQNISIIENNEDKSEIKVFSWNYGQQNIGVQSYSGEDDLGTASSDILDNYTNNASIIANNINEVNNTDTTFSANNQSGIDQDNAVNEGSVINNVNPEQQNVDQSNINKDTTDSTNRAYPLITQ